MNPIKVYVELYIGLEDHTWYLADTIVDMLESQYNGGFGEGILVYEAQKQIKRPEDCVFWGLYCHTKVTNMMEGLD